MECPNPRALPLAYQRRPQRLSITVPQQVFDWIHHQAGLQGRSASNFCAYLLEQAQSQHQGN